MTDSSWGGCTHRDITACTEVVAIDESRVSDTGSDMERGSDSCSGVDEEGLIKDGVSDSRVVVVGKIVDDN